MSFTKLCLLFPIYQGNPRFFFQPLTVHRRTPIWRARDWYFIWIDLWVGIDPTTRISLAVTSTILRGLCSVSVTITSVWVVTTDGLPFFIRIIRTSGVYGPWYNLLSRWPNLDWGSTGTSCTFLWVLGGYFPIFLPVWLYVDTMDSKRRNDTVRGHGLFHSWYCGRRSCKSKRDFLLDVDHSSVRDKGRGGDFLGNLRTNSTVFFVIPSVTQSLPCVRGSLSESTIQSTSARLKPSDLESKSFSIC